MNKFEIAKKAVTIIVGVGTSKIAQTIISNNVQPETVIDKVTVGTGSIVIGMMASEATKKFTDTKMEEYASAIRELKTKIQEAKQEQ